MRDVAARRAALARSVTQARDASDISRVGEAHAGPAAEQFTRYQQELIGAVTTMNTDVIQASYSMMERVGQALVASAGSMGVPASGQGGGAMAAFQAGVRQWQGAVERMTQGLGAQSSQAYEADDDEEEEEVEEPAERPARKASTKRRGRR